MEIPVIEGERLTLRALTDEDIGILLPAIYEPGIAEWWGDTSDPDYQREGLRNDGNALAIVVTDETAGWLCFHEETEPDYRHVAFDILLRPAFQHQGLGADAVRLLIRWFADTHGHHRFTIDPSAQNHRAIKSYKSIGFKPVGILRLNERAPDGTWRDSLLMDLLVDELRDPPISQP
jgi:aminoglycoside 6'-N-acetyltransferase